MTWNKAAGTIVTGAIGLGIGIAMAGKVIKDVTAISTEKLSGGAQPKESKRWRL